MFKFTTVGVQHGFILLVGLLGLLLGNEAKAQVVFPPRIFGDTLHAPFYHGVASGDPLSDAVIIWTRITPDSITSPPIGVNYQVSTDSSFLSIIQAGTILADSSENWTLKKDVVGLLPNQVYYYRFDDGNGHYSQTGRTRTAPTGAVSSLKFAVFSCSSIYSGYFNSYARVAEKSGNLNAAIHVGDYIYDFVDSDEEIRVPTPYPSVPITLDEWRQRQAYYLLDPDLRNARASLPWICLWDNHDQECGGIPACTLNPGIEAFYEWLPIRQPDTTQPMIIYRNFEFGDLAEIFVSDVLMFRQADTLSNGEYNLLGTNQSNWLKQGLLNTSSRWKLIPQQRMVGGWYTNGIPSWILDLVPNDGSVFDLGSWDGYPGTKADMMNFIRSNFINDVIFLSGDAHVSIAQDLVEDPHNTSLYDPVTGAGSAGVEFLPTSITRGNLDEGGAPLGAFSLFNDLDRYANPQHQFTDFFNHGYGLLNIMQDSSIAEFWYCPKLYESGQDSLGATLVVKHNENHWSRNSGYSGVDVNQSPQLLLFPNPTHEFLTMQFLNQGPDSFTIRMVDLYGKVVYNEEVLHLNMGNMHILNVTELADGMYFVELNGKVVSKFIKR